MNSTLRTSLLGLTTLLSLPSLASSQEAVTHDAVRPPQPGDDRIEAALLRAMDELDTRGFVYEGDAAVPWLRVVIELRRRDGDETFDSCKARDPVPVVMESVGRRQVGFQSALPGLIDGASAEDIRIVDALTLQYMLVAEVRSSRALRALAQLEDVKFVFRDNVLKALTIEGRTITGSANAAASGWTGNGVGVAIIDSHFDLMHPELGGTTSVPNAVVRATANIYYGGTNVHSRDFTAAYHGTGTASIARRYAPRASIYALNVFPTNTHQGTNDSYIASAINWCVTNRNGVNGGPPIRVISMSLGGGSYASPITSGIVQQACAAATANGIVCVASSGNNGYTNGINSPAASASCISIGATWDATNAAYTPFWPANCSDPYRLVDERACYSNTAGILDFYAPSEEVICARVGGGTFALGGTSSAAPAAAGMIAQLLHARPTYAGYQLGIESLFATTGLQVVGDPTKRRANVQQAILSSSNTTGGGSLQNGISGTWSMLAGSARVWTINVPPNSAGLILRITGTADADLYVKRAPINWPADQGYHNEPEFKAPFTGTSNESVIFATVTPGTWNVRVQAHSGNPSGTILATWVELLGSNWRYSTLIRETPHPYASNMTYSTTHRQAGARFIGVHFGTLATEAGYDFLRIKDAHGNTIYTVSGNVIAAGAGNAFGRQDGWAVVPGDTITIELVTDHSITAYGFKTDQLVWF